MKRLMKILLLIGTVCLCFFVGILLSNKEVQAASYKEVTVYNEAQLRDYCGKSSGYYKINLGNDISLTAFIYIEGNKIIDGKGHSITIGPNVVDYFNMLTIRKGANVEMANVKIISTEIASHKKKMTMVHVVAEGKLTVQPGCYIEGGGEGSEIACIIAYGTVTINGGTVKGSDEGGIRIIGPGMHVINDVELTGNIAGIQICTEVGNEMQPRVINLNGGRAYKNLHDGLLVWGTHTYESNITLNINNFESYSNGVTGGYSGLDVYNTGGVTVNIKKFKCYDNPGQGIYFSDGSNNVLNINAASKDDVLIYGNYNGLYLIDDLKSLYINNAKIYDNTNNGVYISRSVINERTTHQITKNVEIYENGLFGLYLRRVDVKSGASIYSNKQSGVYMQYGGVYEFDGGVVRDNGTHGVNIQSEGTVCGTGDLYGNNIGIYVRTPYGATVGGTLDIYENISAGVVFEGDISTYPVFSVRLCKATLDGAISIRNNGLYGVYASYAEATIKKATIRDNSRGVQCSNDSNVALEGVSVYNSIDCGVYVFETGTVNIDSTTKIRNNPNGIYNKGTLTTLGSVYNNDETGIVVDGGSVDIEGGSVYTNDTGVEVVTGGVVNVKGGKIHKNTNYGISSDNSTVNIANGELTNNRLGLLLLNGSVTTVNSGKIHTNTQQGIGMKDSTLTVNGGEIYSNTKNGIYIATESDVTITGGKIYSNENHGIQNSGGGNFNISGGEIYGNTKNALYLASGTVLNMSGSKLYNNSIYGMFVADGAKANISGGEITGNNNYAIKLADGSSGTITGGNIHNNGGANGEIWHETDSLVVTGVYDGRSSVNGYIYLAKANNYVTTNDSETLLKIYPSVYSSGRRCILTSSNAKALKQKSSTLKANGEWLLTDNADYVVLTMIPGIYYDGIIMDAPMVLPSADGWYNANTIRNIKAFTAYDADKDLVSFDLYYNGSLLKKGTVGIDGKGSISYDFKHEGIREYELVAADSLGNKVSRKVTIRADFTPPTLFDYSASELDWGQSGSDTTFTWSVVVVDPDVPFKQQGQDALSGVANISYSLYSSQNTFIKRIYNSPYVVGATLKDYPNEKGVVVKVVDRAGNTCYKCILNEELLDIKVEPFFPGN